MEIREYFASVRRAATTIFEGMAVTFSHLFREPITIQYPDRLDRPITEMLPMRYRGLLEVQMDICTGCKRCVKVCPIDCIAIDLEKREIPGGTKKETGMARFDIDMGKCMYCGLCVEDCLAESTGAIRHTREFEAAAATLDGLLFRFLQPNQFQPLYKPPKDKTLIPVGEYGPHAREARERALRDNHEALTKLREAWYAERDGAIAQKRKAAAEERRKALPSPRRVAELHTKVDLLRPAELPGYAPVVGSPAPTPIERFARLLESFTPQTDCGKCGVPTCIDYARALASGKETDPSKCTPGGAEATSDLDVAVARWLGREPVTPEGGAPPPPPLEPEPESEEAEAPTKLERPAAKALSAAEPAAQAEASPAPAAVPAAAAAPAPAPEPESEEAEPPTKVEKHAVKALTAAAQADEPAVETEAAPAAAAPPAAPPAAAPAAVPAAETAPAAAATPAAAAAPAAETAPAKAGEPTAEAPPAAPPSPEAPAPAAPPADDPKPDPQPR